MHIASYVLFREQLEPVLNNFSATLARKVKAFKGVQKVGRTHLQDAVSITLGEEFSGYRAHIDFARQALHEVFAHILEVPIGGTAVGTGLNAPRGFSTRVTKVLANKTGYKFKPSRNSFESMAQHSRLVMVSGTLKVLAVVLMKIANDIRFLGSGPRAGLGELVLPANEPGSSIMPGKVNPTQCEALMMVCAKVIGNDAAIVVGEMSLSNFELEVAKPLLASTIIESVHLLTDAISSFDEHCVRGLKINGKRLKEYEGMSLTEATVMSKDSGYEKVAGMVKQSLKDERN
jgi:fumarate hydratase class II